MRSTVYWSKDTGVGRLACRRQTTICSVVKPPIMVNSCSGKMGHAAAEAVVRAGLELVPYTLTGETIGVAVQNIGVSGIPVEVVSFEKRFEAVRDIKERYPGMIIVDYTLPQAVNGFYVDLDIPFVMGTTGGDREKLKADVQQAGLYAVIAPQMGKQVVAFQAMMEYMGATFPGAFRGYTLEVVESHQTSKVDTSGTAKDVIASLNNMGADFDVSQVVKIRDAVQQQAMGVPEAALTGHAYHTYRLTSPDASVQFEFQHNVQGRVIYAEGTVDAALFLAQQIAAGTEQKVFNMVDVLKAGAMR